MESLQDAIEMNGGERTADGGESTQDNTRPHRRVSTLIPVETEAIAVRHRLSAVVEERGSVGSTEDAGPMHPKNSSLEDDGSEDGICMVDGNAEEAISHVGSVHVDSAHAATLGRTSVRRSLMMRAAESELVLAPQTEQHLARASASLELYRRSKAFGDPSRFSAPQPLTSQSMAPGFGAPDYRRAQPLSERGFRTLLFIADNEASRMAFRCGISFLI